jgi:threonylcarbamoyladenosine tRNA methylthiotransferase MtaB
MSVDIVTFGCRLNIQESDVIRRRIGEAGLDDIAVVNTCAVTSEAVAKARQTIRKLARERSERRIVVTGCAAQAEPKMFADMPEVAGVIGNDEKLHAPAWSQIHTLAGANKITVGDIMQVTRATAQPTSSDTHTRAFVQVQNGCDHRCTFCIIPFGRGNARSVPLKDVVAQVRGLTEDGAPEVVLTGVDLTSYGQDLPGAPRLGILVKEILRGVPELTRLRLSSIDSVEADPDLIDAFASEPRLMPHLHLSLQAGDDLILKRMKRRHLRRDAIAFCECLRQLRPDIVFGADVIAGFPTETDDMFARSLALVDDCGLTHLHVFPFSPRPGTPAARMPQVAREIILERARTLRAKGAGALKCHLDGEIGAVRRVLVERGSVGHTEQFTQVRLGNAREPGVICDVVIAAHDQRALIAA